MLKQERAAYIEKRLEEFYPKVQPPLEHKDPYTLLIAVLLSARCTDARVNLTTPALFKLADNPEDMAQKSVEEVDAIVRPCGIAPRKAQAIVGLSKILIEKYNGVVPQNFEDLEELPGVGHKTASVVMSQAFGYPAFPVDTHIHRMAQRWKLSSGQSVVQTERDLKKLFQKKLWNKLHLQIIYYAREYCPARSCYGLECPLCRELFPKRKQKIISHSP